MRVIAPLLACAGIAVAVAGCSSTDKHYFKEGVGANLYAESAIPIADTIADRTKLQHDYVAEICQQAGLYPFQCAPNASDPNAWSLFVQAGMNDIDQRCDAYLTWLDNVRRAHAPTFKELGDAQTATTIIMREAGVGSAPIAIAAAAFGFATNTYANVTSRLILELDRSTVQATVLGRQKRYREELFGTAAGRQRVQITSRPAAIFALRSYLRLCMPITIETEVNTTVATFENGGTAALAARQPMISAATVGPAIRLRTNFVADDAGTVLNRWIRPGGAVDQTRVELIRKFIAEKNYQPSPQVTTFLNGAAFATGREEFARRQGLIP